MHADLRRRLEAGEFAEAFPGEMKLVDEYGVSRNTVREAVRHLRAEGAVVAGRGRRPRLGSDVEIEQSLGALYSLFSSVEAAGMEQRSVVRALDVRTDSGAAERLGLGPATPLLFLERLRLAAGEPLAIDQVWFPAVLAEGLIDADFTRTGFYDELASRAGVRLTGGHEQIHAVVPSRAERGLLALEPGVAAFVIDRLGFVRDRRVEWRHTVVRGDRFSVVAQFSAGTGYRLGTGDRCRRPVDQAVPETSLRRPG
ncbi:MAG: GntR family transcriptional regulator [Acidimicrobiales bacterium]